MDENKKVIFIGAGRLATQLARHMHDRGFTILQVFSRKAAHALALAHELSATAVTDPAEISRSADIYILAVPDDAIPEMAARLPGNFDASALLLHTSGNTSLAVLENTPFQHTGVFYPLHSFSQGIAPAWEQIPLCLEGNNEKTTARLRAIAGKIGAEKNIYLINSGQRQYLHLAAVFASNFVNYMLYEAAEVLRSQDMPVEILRELCLQTVQKAFMLGPEKAQTGPAIRNDLQTQERHKQLLSQEGLRQIYTLISRQIYLSFRPF